MSVATKNFDLFEKVIQKIEFKRDPTKLIEWMAENGFFNSPAAKTNHDAEEGGLFRHSMWMYESLCKMNELLKNPYSKETLFYVAFGHDICKCGIYQPKEQWHKDEKGKWQSKPGWDHVDPFPVGHGEKSIIIMNRYVELTEEEMLAIRWHMGSFEIGASGYQTRKCFDDAWKLSPLPRMTHAADLMSVSISQEEEMLNGVK